MFSFLSYLLNHGYTWMVKLILLSLLLASWRIFVEPYANDILTFTQWFLNMGVYKLFPEAALEFMLQTIIFFSTFKIFIWIAGIGTPRKEATGFTTRRVSQ